MILPYRGKGKFLINGGLCGVELCPALWPVRTDMEMYVVRRPVYGGPARMLLKKRRARTPGRRPPHRNGGARRLSGYAAKSRSDAPTGGALSEPVPLFPAAAQAANAKGLGPCLSSIQS